MHNDRVTRLLDCAMSWQLNAARMMKHAMKILLQRCRTCMLLADRGLALRPGSPDRDEARPLPLPGGACGLSAVSPESEGPPSLACHSSRTVWAAASRST